MSRMGRQRAEIVKARGWGGGVGIGIVLAAGVALAQGRPSEADLFGAPESDKGEKDEKDEKGKQAAPAGEKPGSVVNPDPAGDTTKAGPPAAGDADDARDAALLSDPSAGPRLSDEVAPEDPLKIGGQFYLRAQSIGYQEQDVDQWRFTSPSLLDAYLDARPNDRVRGYVLGRMQFDPTLSDTPGVSTGGLEASGSTAGTGSLSNLFQSGTRAPRVVLDQMWLRFDIARTVFVTAGKQHVRWGTARFWTPTDYLHFRRRNPLDVFDARTGTSMLKLHLPIEDKGWNFYAYGIYEQGGDTSKLGRLQAAARAEIVLAQTEIGLGAVVQQGRKPKLAVDVSTGIWDLDVYGELALRYGSEIDRVRYAENALVPARPMRQPWEDEATVGLRYQQEVIDALYPVHQKRGIRPQAVGGVSYSRKYNDNDTWTLGAEYFYNALGYDSPKDYPGLVLPHSTTLAEPATFFYLGRHYGALFFTMPAPYNLNKHTFTLSTLGNLSDQSFITRFDYGYTLLTHIRLEAFVSGRYGRKEGEFRFGVSNLKLGDLPAFSIPAAVLDVGVALRVAI